MLEPSILTPDVLAGWKWQQSQELLFFICKVQPKQPLDATPKTGWDVLNLVTSRYFANGARLKTCFQTGSRVSDANGSKLLLAGTKDVDWTHGIGCFQLFVGPASCSPVALSFMFFHTDIITVGCVKSRVGGCLRGCMLSLLALSLKHNLPRQALVDSISFKSGFGSRWSTVACQTGFGS